jgi:pyruvate/2-oxoglutarate dehydrogenase complex dihydrolipoamide dehydrogenase (E3) component
MQVQALSSGIALDTEGPAGPAMHNASHLLLACGTKLKLDDLSLAVAGIKHGSGGIATNARLQTTNPAVFAIGAARQGACHPHGAASETAAVFRTTLLRMPGQFDADTIPRSIATSPALAWFGLQEQGSLPRGARILRQPLTLEGVPAQPGFIKAIIDARGRLLGVTIVAPDADDLIAPWALARRNNLTIDALAGLEAPFLSASEATRRTGLQAIAMRMRSPWVQRLMRVARAFG